jgi:hypothetical protein
MRRVWSEREEARQRGLRAARDVAEQFAPRVVGAIARQRLELVAKRLREDSHSGRRVRETSAELAEVERRFAATAGAGGARQAQDLPGFARRVVLRLMRPFTHHQLGFDAAIVRLLARLQEAVGSERLRGDHDGRRIRRLEMRIRSLERRVDHDSP